ncbi:ABC transporter permease subunit [Bacillus infantis]|uniref:ABC transporter permease subunit n=1 Tax=Bacillus infantis TaxID=324767 RepID=UPI0020A1336B|nr:ABC transporter permease subunit [Bacillus infantis]MCP1160638.1 ABC-2 transporter permease [Bacillus infantis]
MKHIMFELKKLIRQKKFLWLFFIVLLYTMAVYFYHYQQYPEMKDRAYFVVQQLDVEARGVQTQLTLAQKETPENPLIAEQLTEVQGMLSSIFQWKVAVTEERWGDVPKPEGEFLSHLQAFLDSGGVFTGITQSEIQARLDKSRWLQKYNLPYEDEEYPLSAHLILKGGSSVFFGVIGLVLMVLLFGGSLSQEKEQNTWSTLATQLISRWRLAAGKYMSLLVSAVLFAVIVIGVSVLIPLVVHQQDLSMQYPVIAGSEDAAAIIPIYQFVLRAILFFVCASAFLFGLIFFFSSWTKNTFMSIMLTVFFSLAGFILTDMHAVLQRPFNPFRLLMADTLAMTVPSKTDFLYFLGALLWSSPLLIVAGRLLKKEGKQRFSSIHRPFNKGRTQLASSILANFILFEWRKEKRKRLLLQVMAVLSVFIVLGSVILTYEKNESAEAYISGLEEEARVIEEELLPYYEEAIGLSENSQGDKEYAEELKTVLNLYEERLGKVNKAVDGYYHYELAPLQEYHLFELQAANGEFDTNNISQSYVDLLGQFTVDVSLAEKQWMLEKQIDPIIAGEFNPTINTTWPHEQPHLTKEEWVTQNQKIDNSALYSLYYYFDHYFSYIIVVFFFLLGGGLARERGKRAAIQFIRTQPVTGRQVFIGKLIAASSLSLLSWTVLVFLVVLAGAIANGFGDWLYPIVHYDSAAAVGSASYTGLSPAGWSTGFHLESLGRVVLENYALHSLVLVFLIVLSVFLSLFIKNQFSVLAVAAIVCISGYAASTKILSSFAHVLPFTYLNPAKVINGEMSVELNNPGIVFADGCWVMMGAVLVLGAAGYVVSGWDRRKGFVARPLKVSKSI